MSSTPSTLTEREPLLPPSRTSSTLTDDEASSGPVSKDKFIISRTRGGLIAGSMFMLIFILTTNVSLLTTIQSPIATELAAYDSVSWFTSAYLISLASITPLAGKLSQIFTPRIYLFASILAQCVGLLTTCLASSLQTFLLGRVITGIGTAAVTPVAFILATSLVSSKRRGLVFGCINTGYTSGVALGAIFAGALEPAVGWRGVFALQIPVTFLAALTALFAIPRQTAVDAKSDVEVSIGRKLARIDYLGVISFIGAVVLFLFSLAAPHVHATPIVLSGLLLSLFILIEAKVATEPIIPVTVLKSRANILSGVATLGLMTARWGVLFYTPMYALAVRGWTQAAAGLMLLPTNGGFALGGIMAGWLHIRHTGSFYIASLVCSVLFAIVLNIVSQITTYDSNIGLYIVLLFCNGFCTGALLNYTLAHLLHLTVPETHVIVIPLNTMFRGLSGSFGSSVSGGLFLRTLRSTLISAFRERDIDPEKNKHIADLVNKLVGTPALVRDLTGIEKEVAVYSYEVSLRQLFFVGSTMALVTTLIQAGTGWTAPQPTPEDPDVLSPAISRDALAN